MDAKKVNEDLIRFWESALTMPEEAKAEEAKGEIPDYRELAPAPKLYEAVAGLGTCQKVLDYGCGSAWASIIALKSGCPDVTGADMGQGIIDAANFYAELFGVKESFHGLTIAPDWLKSVPSSTYDGLVCSNVLDVVPLETCKEIIQECARVLQKDAKAVIGLNFYMSPEAAEARGIELVEGRYLFMNDVLRLSSLKDEEWKELLIPHFEIEKLDYFAWPNEQKESRRLFLLRRK